MDDAASTTSPAPLPSTALRELCIDNSAVTVWRTIIEPNNELKMHRHDRARVVVGLKGGSLRKVTDTGEESPLVFETGKAYWLEADPPFELHSDENRGQDPIEVLVIEVKSTDESRPAKRRAPLREDWQPPTTKG